MFEDRQDAGRQLAGALDKYYHQKNTVVLALPRGGVVVGDEVARALKLPFDIIVTKKIGSIYNPEFAIAAVGENVVFRNPDYPVIDESTLQQDINRERVEIQRRLETYHKKHHPINIKDKNVIVVDDGLATGLTMQAAIAEIYHAQAAKVIVAVPVAPPDTIKTIRSLADGLVVLATPSNFGAVGQFYNSFPQVSDEEVINLLT